MVIGIVAHVDAGKTTLSEALLYKTGQIRNLGRVDHQDAYLDNDEQERERGITIFSKQARIETENLNITLLDTPGHVDFSAEMERTLQVLDYALLVISGTDGVQGHTRTLWRLLRHYNIPTFIFVNKMDMDGTDEDKILQELRTELNDGCCKLFADCDSGIGEQADELSGALISEGVGKREDFICDEEICEELSMCDEALLNEYMDSGALRKSSIQRAICERKVFPCFFGSALKLSGVEELLDGIKEYAVEKSYPSEFAARVYKIGRDDRGTRLTYMKILGGGIAVREKLEYNNLVEKVDQIRKYSGEKFVTCDSAKAGEIVTITGLTGTYPGQAFGKLEEDNLAILEPVLNYQLILPKEINPAEFLKNMKLLEEEDPSLYVVWNEEHREIHIQLMGQVQMEVLTRLIKDRFGVVVTFGPGSIVYKETVAKPVEGVGHFEPLRHYAEVHLLIEPQEKGSGVTVSSVCSEDILDKNWQRLIATHIEEREHKGVLTGSALTDVKITILTGQAHIKHTEGGDFRQATYRAIRNGLKRGECILLEPYYDFVLEIPMEHVGRALTDLEQRYGKVEAPEFYTVGSRDMARIKGTAPVSTMQDYVSEVFAYSQGLGNLTLDLSGYDECHNPEEVIAERGYDSEMDYKNPTGSVFCAHGSGFIVNWDEVESYMHLPYVYTGDASETILRENSKAFSAKDADSLAGVTRRTSWSKDVAGMTSVELDAELADVYAREFGMSKNDMEEQERRKWRSASKQYEGLSGKPRTVKHDKHGNPIYPAKGPQEEYLIVDGYNIIFAWEDLNSLSKINIDSARDALKDILANYQGYRGCRLILVFDAYKVKGNAGKHENFNGIDVFYTKQDETADAFIERTVHDIRDKYKVTVATNDALEQQTVLSLGALRMSARELKDAIERTSHEGLEGYKTSIKGKLENRSKVCERK